MTSNMPTEYDIAGICERTGLRPNGTGWRDLMKENQFSAANQGPTFGKILMRLFSQIETSEKVSKQLPVAYCLLPIACCLLGVACCLLPVACCLLSIVYCLLHVACCLLSVVAGCLTPVPADA